MSLNSAALVWKSSLVGSDVVCLEIFDGHCPSCFPEITDSRTSFSVRHMECISLLRPLYKVSLTKSSLHSGLSISHLFLGTK